MRNNEQGLGDSLQDLLRRYGLKTKSDEYKLVSKWDTIVGGFIAGHTDKIYVSGKRLFVRVTSSDIKYQLVINREKVLSLVNEQMGPGYVDDLVLL